MRPGSITCLSSFNQPTQRTFGARMAAAASPGILCVMVVLTATTARTSLAVHPSQRLQRRPKSRGVDRDRSCVTTAEDVCYTEVCVTESWTVRMARTNRDVVSVLKRESAAAPAPWWDYNSILQDKPPIHQNLLRPCRPAEPPICFVLGRLRTSASLQTKFATVLRTVLMALTRTTVCNNVQQSVNLYAPQPFFGHIFVIG